MSLKLRGSRFDDGSMPISRLAEVENIRTALIALAKQREPDGVTAVNIDPHVAFTKGCVVATLYLPPDDNNDSVIAEYRNDGDRLQRYLEDFYAKKTNDFGNSEINEAIQKIGFSLAAEDELVINAGSDDATFITISQKTRNDTVDYYHRQIKLINAPAPQRKVKDDVTLYGRFTELDAEKKHFTFVDRENHEFKGNYEIPALTADIRAVLDGHDIAPITRIKCRIKYKDGKPWRIRPLYSCEQIDVGNSQWSQRLAEIIILPKDWGGDGVPIVSIVAIDAARSLLSFVNDKQFDLPGIFPTDDGGVLLEWGSANAVRSVEISSEAKFELFSLAAGEEKSNYTTTSNINEAKTFIANNVDAQVEQEA